MVAKYQNGESWGRECKMVSYYHTKVWVLTTNYGWGRQGYYVNLVSQDTKVGVDRGYV